MAGKLCNGYGTRSAAIPRESKAFCEGQLARQQDELFSDNPHSGGNAKSSWSMGWALVDQLAPSAAGVVIGCCAALEAISGTPTAIKAAWDDTLPAINEPQGSTWTIDLNDYIIYGSTPITFAVNTGILPTGITLNTDGTFSGTLTNTGGAGSLTFIATNAAGDSLPSPTLSWTII